MNGLAFTTFEGALKLILVVYVFIFKKFWQIFSCVCALDFLCNIIFFGRFIGTLPEHGQKCKVNK